MDQNTNYNEYDDNRLNQDYDFKALLKFTLPTMLLMMFTSLYSTIDGFFVANFVGENAYAALNLVFPWTLALLAIGLMIGTGGCAILSRQMGQNKVTLASNTLSQLTIFAIIIGLILSIIGTLNADHIVRFLGATDLLAKDAQTYLGTLALFAIPFLLQLSSQMFFIADGRPEFGFIVGTIGGVANIVLDFIFIAIFNLGIFGAALATGIGYSIPALTFLVYFLKREDNELRFKKFKFSFNTLLETCINGSSEMVTGLAGTITSFLFNITILNLVGEIGVVAVGVVSSCQFLFQSAYIGFSQGVSPLISYNYGANRYDRLKTLIRLSIIMNLIAGVIIYGITLVSAESLTSLYISPTSEAFNLTKTGLLIFAIAFIPQGFTLFASAMFTALSNGKVSAILSFIRTLVLIVIFILILPELFGVIGVWLAIPCAEAISVIISIITIKKYQKVYHY